MAEDYLESSEQYVDRLFGKGKGAAHRRFLERIQDDALREMIHRFHLLEADDSVISLEENYLIGMCVLCATSAYATAAMFAKILLHLGVDKKKILAALARLPMWSGGLQSVEATFVIQRAIQEYEAQGEQSLDFWFPKEKR